MTILNPPKFVATQRGPEVAPELAQALEVTALVEDAQDFIRNYPVPEGFSANGSAANVTQSDNQFTVELTLGSQHNH